VRICAVVEREQVVELEQRPEEREGLDDIKFGRELETLTTHESSLNRREATLEAGQKDLKDARLTVTTHELAANIKGTDLDTRAVGLAEREKLLAER
jgi:hypothetical protein